MGSLHIDLKDMGIIELAGPDSADFWCKCRSYKKDIPRGQCLCSKEGKATLVEIEFCNRLCPFALNQ